MLMIDRNKLPEDEHEAALSIQHGLSSLRLNVEAFAASFDLYIYAHERKMGRPVLYDSRRMISWISLAGTNGAIAAASFVNSMYYIASLGGPELRKQWLSDEYKAAKKLIQAELPGIKGVRASAAHPGEWLSNAAESAKHTLRETTVAPGLGQFGPGVTVVGSMNALTDRLEFSATYFGQLETYTLSAETLAAIATALNHMEAAYEPLSAWPLR